jgi:hypothetical protein
MDIGKRLSSGQFCSATALRPFPDETLGSIAARYHLWSCNISTRQSLFETFGHRGFSPNSALPSHLRNFSRLLTGTDSKHEALAIARENTLLPYFSFFCRSSDALDLAKCMIEGAHPKAHAGLLASTFGAGDVLKFCPACVAKDIEGFGIAYWHRRHQLPEVVICSTHEVLLVETIQSADLHDRHALRLPPRGSVRLLPSDASSLTRKQIHFSRESSELLDLNANHLSPEILLSAYKDRLVEMGLAKKSGRVDQIAFRSEITAYHEDFCFLPHVERLHIRSENGLSWLERIVRKPRTRQHPVLHLLLVSFLFGSPMELLAYIRTPLEKKNTMRQQDVPDESMKIRSCLKERALSLRAAAIEMGRSVAYVRARAKGLSIKFNQRPFRISEDLELTISSALLAGASVKEAANASHVSIVSVYRIIQGSLELKTEIKRLALRKQLHERRARFQQMFMHGCAAICNVRKASPADYAWLARHDREWLSAIVRQHTTRASVHRPRVDWTARDEVILSQIRLVVTRLLSPVESPVRITITELGRRTGSVSLLQKKLHKLPRTAEYLQQVVETTTEYQIRRIDWVISSTHFASVSDIARRAGMNDLSIVLQRLKLTHAKRDVG